MIKIKIKRKKKNEIKTKINKTKFVIILFDDRGAALLLIV